MRINSYCEISARADFSERVNALNLIQSGAHAADCAIYPAGRSCRSAPPRAMRSFFQKTPA